MELDGKPVSARVDTLDHRTFLGFNIAKKIFNLGWGSDGVSRADDEPALGHYPFHTLVAGGLTVKNQRFYLTGRVARPNLRWQIEILESLFGRESDLQWRFRHPTGYQRVERAETLFRVRRENGLLHAFVDAMIRDLVRGKDAGRQTLESQHTPHHHDAGTGEFGIGCQAKVENAAGGPSSRLVRWRACCPSRDPPLRDRPRADRQRFRWPHLPKVQPWD